MGLETRDTRVKSKPIDPSDLSTGKQREELPGGDDHFRLRVRQHKAFTVERPLLLSTKRCTMQPTFQPPQEATPSSLEFEVICLLGSGTYANVVLSQLAQNPEEFYAIKMVRKHFGTLTQHWLRERDVLLSLSHPFITKLFGYSEDPTTMYFAMEYCAGGDLYFMLEQFPNTRLPEQHVGFYAASMALVIHYIHQRGVIHRDLKPENILLDAEGFIRVADFGLAKDQMEISMRKDGRVCRQIRGSDDYIAPEVILGQGYSYAADLWSFGCVLYELLTGFPPFFTETSLDEKEASAEALRDELFHRILHEEPCFPGEWSTATTDFVQRLLQKDPSHRLGCGSRGMQELFEHDLLREMNWHALWTKQVHPPYVPTVTHALDTSNFESRFTCLPIGGVVRFEGCWTLLERQDEGFEAVEWPWWPHTPANSKRIGSRSLSCNGDVSTTRQEAPGGSGPRAQAPLELESDSRPSYAQLVDVQAAVVVDSTKACSICSAMTDWLESCADRLRNLLMDCVTCRRVVSHSRASDEDGHDSQS